eukprot:GSChrysophyteH1.ASY1.ANO1.2689.1 assembled CDS
MLDSDSFFNDEYFNHDLDFSSLLDNENVGVPDAMYGIEDPRVPIRVDAKPSEGLPVTTTNLSRKDALVRVPPRLPDETQHAASRGGRGGRSSRGDSSKSNAPAIGKSFANAFSSEEEMKYMVEREDRKTAANTEKYSMAKSAANVDTTDDGVQKNQPIRKRRVNPSAITAESTQDSARSMSLSDQHKLERRERNREHAKRSRVRKMVMLDLLSDQLNSLRLENRKLRQIITRRIPNDAAEILENSPDEDKANANPMKDGDETQAKKYSHAKVLMEPDFRLISALQGAQKNFCITDPSLPDNPIVYCSDGFCKVTGYKRNDVVGRNCRFLQGPGTDLGAVDLIRTGIAEGRDVSVCLLNYKADGTPFWNQFFVAALTDADGEVVNYVGVQQEVDNPPVQAIKDRVKRLQVDTSLH